jgi:hypothetical protein
MGKEGQKLRAVTDPTDDVQADITSAGNMIDSPGKLKTKRTDHGGRIYPSCPQYTADIL